MAAYHANFKDHGVKVIYAHESMQLWLGTTRRIPEQSISARAKETQDHPLEVHANFFIHKTF